MLWQEVTVRLMREGGVRQADIAAALGITRQAVGHKLKGLRPTTTDELEIIAGLLGVRMQDLIGGDVRYVADDRTRELVDLFAKLETDEQRDAFIRSLRLGVERAERKGLRHEK